jgi:hypothetical protein
MFRKNSVITGHQLAAKWKIDLFNLSYTVLKHDLSILKKPKSLLSKFFFDYQKSKLTSEQVLEIIQSDPKALRDELFLIEEIEKLHLPAGFQKTYSIIRSERQSTEPKQKETYSIPPAQGVQYSRGHAPLRDEPSNFDNLLRQNKEFEGVFNNIVLRNVIEAHEDAISQHPNVYSLIGKVWFIKFMQKEWGLYPDYEKYKYIAFLLSLPSNGNGGHQSSINNRELVLMFNKKPPDDKSIPEDKLEDLNNLEMRDNMSGQDRAAFIDYKNQLESKIKAAELSGDPEQKKKVDELFDEFRRIVSNTYGMACGISPKGKIFIKNRVKASNELEKSRQLIKGHIRNARKDFADRMPILSKHLKNCIKPQKFQTSYSPEQPTTWYVSM